MKKGLERRVLLIDATANFSGGLVYVAEILPRLVEALKGWRIVVFGPKPMNCTIEADHPNVTWITANPGIVSKGFVVRGVLKLLWRQFVLPFHAFRERADVVFSTANFSSFLFDLASVPVVIALHNLVPFHSANWYRESSPGMYLRTILVRMVTLSACHGKCSFVLFSKYARSILAENGVDRPRTCLAYHGSPAWAERWSGARSLNALLVSNYFAYKRMETVMEAWKKALPQLPPGARLTIQGVVGDRNYFDTISRLRDTLGIADSVELGRGVPLEQLRFQYQNARCLLFPPIGENCPMTLMEAMRIGVPIIGTSSNPVPEICGPAGLYFNDGDSGECARLIARLFNEPELGSQMSRIGQERSFEFSWEIAAERTAHHIKQVSESCYEQDSTETLARKRVAKNVP